MARRAVVTGITEALRDDLRRPGGRVIGISSIAALRGAGWYGAANGAMHSWVLSLATQLGPDGITMNAVAPGFIPDTEFWEGRLNPTSGLRPRERDAGRSTGDARRGRRGRRLSRVRAGRVLDRADPAGERRLDARSRLSQRPRQSASRVATSRRSAASSALFAALRVSFPIAPRKTQRRTSFPSRRPPSSRGVRPGDR